MVYKENPADLPILMDPREKGGNGLLARVTALAANAFTFQVVDHCQGRVHKTAPAILDTRPLCD